jgi:hypothetical protein
MQQKTIKFAALALLSLLAITFAALGVLKYTATVTNTAMIKGYKIALWNTVTNAEINEIPWGDIDLNIPKDTEMVFTSVHQIKVKNVGNYDCFIAWKMNDTIPSGVSLSCDYWDGDSAGSWKPFSQNDYSTLPQLSVNDYSKPFRWVLTASNDAPMGSLTFKIYLLDANTAAG